MTRAREVLPMCVVLALGCASQAPATEEAGPADAAAPDAGPPLVVESVVDLGILPLPSATTVGRDGVSSAVVDGQLLWAFGDTFVTDASTTVDGSNVVSATGAWATPAAPLLLEQPVDAHGIPAQLIPYTADELAQNQLAPLDGWALWPAAVIDTGDPALLVLFQRIQRSMGGGFAGVGVATARIAPHETVAVRAAVDLFSRPLPPATGGTPLYGVGGVSVIGDTVYWLACESLSCRLARTPRDRADERDAFEFFDGSGWVADVSAAAIVLRNVPALTSLSFNAHLGRFLSVTSRLGSDEVLLRTAPAIEGPWPSTGVVVAPSAGGIVPAGEGTDYLAQEHVALSSADGREVVISYARPLGSFRGEVHLARITLR